MDDPSRDVTLLLAAWRNGDQSALAQLLPLVYEELRRIAQIQWNRQSDAHTLQPTALIHEAFLKLVDQRHKGFENRTHFFAVAATAMRQVLVNYAQASQTEKRGRGQAHLPLSAADLALQKEARDVLALNEALQRLHLLDARKSRLVELRYFAGLSSEEIAESLNVSLATVSRDWKVARAWLARELGADNTVNYELAGN